MVPTVIRTQHIILGYKKFERKENREKHKETAGRQRPYLGHRGGAHAHRGAADLQSWPFRKHEPLRASLESPFLQGEAANLLQALSQSLKPLLRGLLSLPSQKDSSGSSVKNRRRAYRRPLR